MPAEVNSSDSIRPHPLGVKPLGNKYLSPGPDARCSIGSLQLVPDEVLMAILEYFEARTLRELGYTCKFLFAFCHADELWRSLFLETRHQNDTSFSWRGTWRSTVLNLGADQRISVNCGNVFSDVIHRPFACSQVDLEAYTSGIPRRNQIRRFSELAYDEFSSRWADTPFILTECIRSWPILAEWDIETLEKKYGDVSFRAEAVDWPFSTYAAYLRDNQDESPLYLFDRKFAEKTQVDIGSAASAYRKPSTFGDDLFEVLGRERPAHRWLIVGPRRSGSTFHKDPNGTSAWNAVVRGSKYWILFPPSAQVPGVFVSRDSSEVTSPLSIAEWLLGFHGEARAQAGCVEGVCAEGEVVHVPSGWWHLVVNLEPGVAVTQNFVARTPGLGHLAEVLAFLRDRPEQVTGFPADVADPHGLFVQRLRERYPGLVEEAGTVAGGEGGSRKRKWEAAVGAQETAFSFGFQEEDDDDEEEEEE